MENWLKTSKSRHESVAEAKGRRRERGEMVDFEYVTNRNHLTSHNVNESRNVAVNDNSTAMVMHISHPAVRRIRVTSEMQPSSLHIWRFDAEQTCLTQNGMRFLAFPLFFCGKWFRFACKKWESDRFSSDVHMTRIAIQSTCIINVLNTLK